MEQAKSNSPATQQSEQGQERFHVAQKLYEEYHMTNDENLFERLITLMDSIYGQKVRQLLKLNGCFNDETEHTALQEARIAIWQRICKCRENGAPDPDFIRYCKGIYYHKGMDAVRAQNTYRKRFSDKQDRPPISLDATISDSGKSIGDIIEDTQNTPESGISLAEQKRVFNSIFVLYCQCLVNAKAEPPRELALYYARILPHVIGAIPESKMASAKWAFERMKDQTLKELGEKSETEMQELINQTLRWNEKFWYQLENTICLDGGKVYLKDVIYTDVYNSKKIEDWSESMHRAVAKDIANELMKNQQFVESAVEYISDRDKIYCLFKGGRDK